MCAQRTKMNTTQLCDLAAPQQGFACVAICMLFAIFEFLRVRDVLAGRLTICFEFPYSHVDSSLAHVSSHRLLTPNQSLSLYVFYAAVNGILFFKGSTPFGTFDVAFVVSNGLITGMDPNDVSNNVEGIGGSLAITLLPGT